MMLSKVSTGSKESNLGLCAVLHQFSNIGIIHLALISILSSKETLQYCQNIILTASLQFIGQIIVLALQVGFQGSDRQLACLYCAMKCETYLLEVAMFMAA